MKDKTIARGAGAGLRAGRGLATSFEGEKEPELRDRSRRGFADSRYASEARMLRKVGQRFHGLGWSLATSSNYSVVLSRDPLRLLITASGRDKGRLSERDLVAIDSTGHTLDDEAPRPSAEALLHVVVAEQPNVGAVLHTHSVWATLLSEQYHSDGGLAVAGYEMLKGLSGVTSHEHTLWLEIFENTQNIPELAERVRLRLADPEQPLRHGFLIRRHGLYTWGRDLAEACRHVEAFEFLLEVVGRAASLGLGGTRTA